LVHDARTKQIVNSLEECLGDMEGVNVVGLGHNRSGLDVSFRHDRVANVRGLWWGKELCFGALDSRHKGTREVHERREEVCEPRVTVGWVARIDICLNSG
jgi:hypothetical protein